MGGEPGPHYLMSIFRCDEIGVSSDSQYCNPRYDELYDRQLTEAGDERKATLTEMQNIIYDEAPYDILFYDSYLDVYRNDRFANWQNMPSQSGTPLFTYGTLDYTLLTDATAQPSSRRPRPSPPHRAAASPPLRRHRRHRPTTRRAAGRTRLILAVLAVVAVVVVGGVVMAGDGAPPPAATMTSNGLHGQRVAVQRPAPAPASRPAPCPGAGGAA